MKTILRKETQKAFVVLSLLGAVLFTSCNDSGGSDDANIPEGATVDLDRPVNYYHWKSDFNPSKDEINQLVSLGSKKLYLHLFDVKWVPSENAAYPFATIKLPGNGAYQYLKEIVPTVYITNETLNNTSLEGIGDLVYRISGLINNQTYELESKGLTINEYQFDCDWTDMTRDKYFRFLEEMKQRTETMGKPKNITCTIRLHQVKYFERTGVPPVSKGVLMFYNMGKINDPNEENSILNLETAEKYLENFDDYPLKMDIALPLFNWGVQFRNDKIIRILNNVQQEELEAHDLMQSVGDRKFEVMESTYVNGNFVYKNDVIKVEGPTKEDLIAALEMLDGEVKGSPEIIFYHLNQRSVKTYNPETIAEIVKK